VEKTLKKEEGMHKKLTFLFVLLLASSTAFAQGNTTFSWDGEIRGQYHYWGNEDLDTADINDDFFNYKLLRTRLGVKAEVMENTSVYLQIQDSRYAGNEFNVYDADGTGFFGLDGLGVHQAYIMLDKLWDSPFSLKAGRQELTYGDGRLIGSDNWANTGTAFDAAKLMFNQGRVSIDLFTGQLTPFWGTFSGSLANNTMSGLYASVNYLEHGMWDVYLLLYYDGSVGDDPDESPAVSIDNNTMLWTLGTRTSGMLIDDNLSYHGEFAYQLGDWLSSDVSAWAFSVGAGYSVPGNVAPYFGVELNYASGDDSVLDGDRHTFTNLFPANHGKYGAMDQFAWQNLIHLKATAGIKPVEKLDFHGDFHFFWLAQENDAWYRTLGQPIYGYSNPNAAQKFGRGAGGTANNAGNELDLLLKYQYNDAVSWSLGFSHFFAGDVVDTALATGPTTTDAGDANWFYSQIKVGF
jgi:hypothetical protein